MKNWLYIFLIFGICSCSSPVKHNGPMLEKYPACYHINPKLEKKCIDLNESGKATTALELENAAYPGQYD